MKRGREEDFGGRRDHDEPRRGMGRGRGRSMVMPAWMKQQQLPNPGTAPNGQPSPSTTSSTPTSAPSYQPPRRDSRGFDRRESDRDLPPSRSTHRHSHSQSHHPHHQSQHPHKRNQYHETSGGDRTHRNSTFPTTTTHAGVNSTSTPSSATAAAVRVGERIGRWIIQLDPATQVPYYWDPVKQKSTWTPPQQPPGPPASNPPPLPSDAWVEVLDPWRGRHYYWNEDTGETTWELPSS